MGAGEEDQPASRVVDGTDRAWREWLQNHARDRELAFEQTRRKLIARRRTERSRMSLLERHQLVVAELARLSTVPAGNVEPSRGGSERVGPPRQQTVEAELEHPRRLMEIAIVSYEAVLDEQQGYGALRGVDQMIAEEKDRIILGELEGWSPAEIEVIYQGKLGSAATIRRVRRNANRSPRDGRPLRLDAALADSPGVDL